MDSGAPALKWDKCLEFQLTGLSPVDLAHFGLPQPEEEEDGCGQISPGHKKIHFSPWLREQIRQRADLMILEFWDSIACSSQREKKFFLANTGSAISSCPIIFYLGEETKPHLVAPSCDRVIIEITFLLRTFRNQMKCYFGRIINNISV